MGLLGDVLRCLSPLIVTGSLLGNGVMMLMVSKISALTNGVPLT